MAARTPAACLSVSPLRARMESIGLAGCAAPHHCATAQPNSSSFCLPPCRELSSLPASHHVCLSCLTSCCHILIPPCGKEKGPNGCPFVLLWWLVGHFSLLSQACTGFHGPGSRLSGTAEKITQLWSGCMSGFCAPTSAVPSALCQSLSVHPSCSSRVYAGIYSKLSAPSGPSRSTPAFMLTTEFSFVLFFFQW